MTSGSFIEAGVSSELVDGSYQLTDATHFYGDGDIGTPGSSSAAVNDVPIPAAAYLFGCALMSLACQKRKLFKA